jgi:vancomycin permeability regulator SanA
MVWLATALVIVVDGLSDNLHRADVAVIPGNTVLPDGKPSPRLQARLDRALQLYRQEYFSTIIVSGGFGQEGYDEATVMKRYLVEHDTPDAQVILDQHGDNTQSPR